MDCKEMGARIKRARLKQNLTQEQLAELLDISVSYVSLIERGSRNATVETRRAECFACIAFAGFYGFRPR